MNSRCDFSRLRELHEKTEGPRKKVAELDSELSLESTILSTTFDSVDSSMPSHTLSFNQEHIKGCRFKYTNSCICDLLKRSKMRQEKRKQWSTRPVRELTSNDTILAGHEKTEGPRKKVAELDSELRLESTISSTPFDSVDSSMPSHTLSFNQEHIKGCASKYRNSCTCDLLKIYKMNQEKRKQWSTRPVRQLTSNDTILAGNVGGTSDGTSRTSSDSFHSAQSTIDDIQIVYCNLQKKSITSSNESTVGSLDIVVSEPKPRDTNHNIDSKPGVDREAKGTLNSSDTTDETSRMMPFLEKLYREINISPQSIEDKPPNIMNILATPFAKNPADFQEKLVTIIEESGLNSYIQTESRSCENLSRLTTEFRRACKYIQDESMPTLMGTSPNDHSKTFVPSTSGTPVNTSIPNSLSQRKSSVNFQTPVQEDQKNIKKVYRKTPKKLVEHVQKSNQSPLCIAMLKKTNGTPRTPIITSENATPVSDKSTQRNGMFKGSYRASETPLRTPTNIAYNDSFAYWEDYANKNATPVSEDKKMCLMRRSKSAPDIEVQIQAERIKRTVAIQYHCLDDSPSSLPNYPRRIRSVEHESYDTFESHHYHMDSNKELADSILEEVVKKRLRCFETEKTIREIDAASVSAEDYSEGDNVLEYLHSVVGRCSEYHQYLIENRDVIEKTVRKIDEKRPTAKANAQASTKTPVRTMKSAKKFQPVMSELKRPAFVVNFRQRSPIAVSKSPKVKPIIRSKHGETSLYLRGLSAKKTTSRSTSPAVCQPTPSRIANQNLITTQSTPNLALTSKPVTPKLRPVSGGKIQSKPLTGARSPAKLSIARTPARINEKNYLRTNSVTVRSKLPRTPISVSAKSKSVQDISSISRTPATLASRPTLCSREKKLLQNSEKLSLTTSKPIQTPVKNRQKPTITYRVGNFFDSPAKPDQKASKFLQAPAPTQQKFSVLSKRGKYFETPVKAKEKRKAEISSGSTVKKTFPGRAAYYGYDTVKSPVAEYINSTDAKLVQNIRSKDNALLLTPKAKQTATSIETLRVKLGGNCESQKNGREAENDENIPDVPMDSFPKVMYRPPARVYAIDCSPSSKSRGGHGKVLREINDRRIITRHEGRVQDDLAEQSIHISKPAEKSNYVGYSQATKKPFK